MLGLQHQGVVDTIRQALRNLMGNTSRKRAKLEQLTWLRSSCLISEYTRVYPGVGFHRALSSVFAQVLEGLAEHHSMYALLLRRRFWDGIAVTKLLDLEWGPTGLYGPISERQLYIIQKEAIELFTDRYLELESRCRADTRQASFREVADGENIQPKIIGRSSSWLGSSTGSSNLQPIYVSNRELDVLSLYADGNTIEEVANRLSVAPNTVRTHLQRIKEKLNARNTTHALAEALRYGFLEVVSTTGQLQRRDELMPRYGSLPPGEPARSLAGRLAEIHESDWGPGNPGHPEQNLKTITSSKTLAKLLWDEPGSYEHNQIVGILEEWEPKGYVKLAKPMGTEEVLVTGMNVGILRIRYNL
jgi:DNA-binding CsgD family transcriptional regulator